LAHLVQDPGQLAVWRADCAASGLKIHQRYLCFKVYNATDEDPAEDHEFEDAISVRNSEETAATAQEEEEKDGSSPSCTRVSGADFQKAQLKVCTAEYLGCKLEFWHDAIEGLDNYNMETFSRKASVFIKYYNKTNNSVILYNDDIDQGFEITAVICPYYINKFIVIGVFTGIFVLIFVALFSMYFILINLYDRWEYQRFLEDTKDIFERGNVKENPISKPKSRLSMAHIRNRLSRMSVRPS
jgi:hypothetical protein